MKTDELTKAITDFPNPTCEREVKSFLGMTQFFPNF
jgi:hypothetical protein